MGLGSTVAPASRLAPPSACKYQLGIVPMSCTGPEETKQQGGGAVAAAAAAAASWKGEGFRPRGRAAGATEEGGGWRVESLGEKPRRAVGRRDRQLQAMRLEQ